MEPVIEPPKDPAKEMAKGPAIEPAEKPAEEPAKEENKAEEPATKQPPEAPPQPLTPHAPHYNLSVLEVLKRLSKALVKGDQHRGFVVTAGFCDLRPRGDNRNEFWMEQIPPPEESSDDSDIDSD